MMKGAVQKASQTSSAVHNRRLAVQLLRHHGALSRQQLAQITGLRSSTLTYIVRELLDKQIVRTVGKRKSKSVGKKQVLLEINPNLGWVVGVGIDRDSVTLSCLDAAGKVIEQVNRKTGHVADEIPSTLVKYVQDWSREHDQPMDKLLGLGIATPGVVDYTRGIVLKSTWLNTQNFPMGRLVSDAIGAPVIVDNDANFAALAEARRGCARDLGTFVYFFVSSQLVGDKIQIYGLGSTFFLNHTLYRGTHFSSGEIDASLEPSPESRQCVTPEQLQMLADPDGPMPMGVDKVIHDLAATMSSVVNLIDPEAVVLGGNVCIANRHAVKALETAINSMIVPLPNRYVEVRTSRFVEHGNSMGAAFAAIEAVQISDNEPTPIGQIPAKGGNGSGALRSADSVPTNT
ncbi:MAG: ROK family transcriptional regulator [Phycisphaeraceae bacterium]